MAQPHIAAVTTGTIRADTELAASLHAELTQILQDAKDSLVTGLPFEKYQQACGMIEAYSQVRDVLIPRTIEDLQRR